MEKKKKRFTIGVLVSGILDEFTKYVCKGILQGAKLAGVNTVIIPGKYIDRDLSDNQELQYEYQYNTIFSYLKKENIDAIIAAAGTIGCFTSEMQIRKMLAQYGTIPCVLVASKLDGYRHVVFDNYQGIKEGLEFLINKGCRHFGMVGGNLENTDSYERKQAFVRTLESNGIPFTDNMYVEGDFSRRSVGAFRKLLDDNPELEAVFCVNDETTIGLYEELKRRGLKPGKDLYVFGYDDTIVAAKANPSLASVRADPGKLGEEAVRMAVRLLNGEQIDSRVVATQFVRRDSVDRSWDEKELDAYGQKEGDTGFDDVFYRYLHEEMQEQMEKLRTSYEKMIKAFLGDTKCESDSLENYLNMMYCVDEFLNLDGTFYADMDNLLLVLEGIYRSRKSKCTDDKERLELRNFYASVYKKIILAMNQQSGSLAEQKEKESYEMKLFVQNMLQFEKAREQNYGLLLKNLSWLHVKNACIYMLPEPVLHLYGEDFVAPSHLYLKAVLWNEEVHTIPADQQMQKVGNLFENRYFPADVRFDRILLPLFSTDMVYGVLLCNMDESLYVNGEFLINQISAAIKMLLLLQTNEAIQQQLEENLAALKMHNIELDNISKSDMLTGILNRRGFFDEAGALLTRFIQESRQALVLYVDMNNLKIINDRYGHEEGDFSLKLIGQFLLELVEGCGIAGRIGGDEYACVLEYKGMEGGTEIVRQLHRQFEEFNESSDKVYNVTVSVGECVVGPGMALGLEDALARADDRLYEEKQYRKKEVAK